MGGVNILDPLGFVCSSTGDSEFTVMLKMKMMPATNKTSIVNEDIFRVIYVFVMRSVAQIIQYIDLDYVDLSCWISFPLYTLLSTLTQTILTGINQVRLLCQKKKSRCIIQKNILKNRQRQL